MVEFLTSFDANGGVFFDGKDYTETAPQKDGSVVFPLLPTREGYTLTGWSYDREGADPFVEGTKLDKRVTLYAQWQKNDVVSTHTVTFHAEDGTFLQTGRYKSDQAFGLFSEGIAPEKGGYEFAGWTYGDEAHTPVKADGVVTGDWHVYASYVRRIPRRPRFSRLPSGMVSPGPRMPLSRLKRERLLLLRLTPSAKALSSRAGLLIRPLKRPMTSLLL